MATLQDRINELPLDLRREVENFVDFLLAKRGGKSGQRLKLDWAGALKDHRDQYTSVDVQKKAMEWRGDVRPTDLSDLAGCIHSSEQTDVSARRDEMPEAAF